MLEHKSVKAINAPIDYCLRCASNPEEFFKHSKYTYTVKKIGDNLYEVVFRWVKWSIERFYKVRIRVERTEDRVLYKSTRDSPYYFTLEFTFKSLPGESTEITVYSSMKAGFMADLLGRKDYREFIEELVEKGIRASPGRWRQRLKPLPAGLRLSVQPA